MNEIQKITWIDRYLQGDMEDDEKARFEQQCGDDPDLAAELALQQEIRQIAGDNNLLELSRNVRAMLRNATAPDAPVEKKPVRTILIPAILAIAAAITLIIAAVYWIARDHKAEASLPMAERPPATENPGLPAPDQPAVPVPDQPDKPVPSMRGKSYLALAEANYRAPVFPVKEAVRGTKDSIPLTLMELAYGQYAEALQHKNTAPAKATEQFRKLEALLTSPPDSISMMAHFLRGHVRYQLHAFEAAAADFDLVSQQENQYRIDAQWFQALCLLSTKAAKYERARQLLQGLAEGNSPNRREQARELLAKIQSQ